MLDKIYQKDLNSRDLWKLLALILMILDHTGLYILNDFTFLRVIGRLSFPIFSILYGYSFSNKINKKLLLYGLPLVILNYMIYDDIFLNILYSYFIASCLLIIYNKISTTYKLDKIFFIIILILFHPILNIYFDYGLFAFFFMVASNQKNTKIKLLYFILVFLSYYISQINNFEFSLNYSYIFLIALSIEAIILYNYKNFTINTKNNLFQVQLKILARYSAEIFVLQTIIFQLYHYIALTYIYF